MLARLLAMTSLNNHPTLVASQPLSSNAAVNNTR
jgi:hypothetical protein